MMYDITCFTRNWNIDYSKVQYAVYEITPNVLRITRK